MDTLHGNIWVESEPGRGSTFRLDFPVAKSTDVQAVQPVAVTYETINLKSGRRKHIFLVDDNPEIGGFLADILERDFEISTFFTAESVLSSLRHHPVPDLLICDLMMPAMNGFELIGEIRRTPAYGNMKILVLTAMTAPDVGDRARAIGADDIIWKPFTRDALEQKILKLVSETASSGPPGDYINALIPARDLSEEQLAWLSRLNGLVAMHISDPGFSVDGLAASMFISRITLFREMDKLTGMTPNEYIQGFRLEYARKLLESGKANSIAGVLDEIGLRNKPYFARIYKARFGKAPHTYFNGLSE
jgi:CheY-like chemotaxis protein